MLLAKVPGSQSPSWELGVWGSGNWVPGRTRAGGFFVPEAHRTVEGLSRRSSARRSEVRGNALAQWNWSLGTLSLGSQSAECHMKSAASQI